MGGLEEGTGTTIEVDFGIVKVVTKSIQVALKTIEATIETMQPLTLATILESDEVIENPLQEDIIKIAPIVE